MAEMPGQGYVEGGRLWARKPDAVNQRRRRHPFGLGRAQQVIDRDHDVDLGR